MHVQYSFIFIKSNLLFCQIWKQNLKTSDTGLILSLWAKVLFLPKLLIFRKKCWQQQNLRDPDAEKYILWNYIRAYTSSTNTTKFRVSRINLTSFERGRSFSQVLRPLAAKIFLLWISSMHWTLGYHFNVTM